jgi:uncharacterized RDD family membrane protein YckC
MSWFYVEEGKQSGPVNDEQFNGMVASGKIAPDTLVWREGMTDWVSCREVKGEAAATAAGGTPMTPEAVCAECGKLFPVDETIRYGNVRVCAGCKPVFLQKLQEGASLNTGQLNYAGFGTRVGAYLLDVLILFAFGTLLRVGMGLSMFQTPSAPAVNLGLQLFLSAFQFLVGIAYEVVFVGKYGATPGKMACKLKVVTADGGRVTYLRAFGRYFAKMLSGLTCLIGFIIAAFDNPQRRALHDHICNTRVVYK